MAAKPGRRPETRLELDEDLRRFFADLGLPPQVVSEPDVLAFVAGANAPPRRLQRQIRRVHAYYTYLATHGVDLNNPVPERLTTRRRKPAASAVPGPTALTAAEATALIGVLRTRRDRAMVLAILLGGLRSSEVLGLRVRNVRRKKGVVAVGPERRAVPIAGPFFDAVDGYREAERPSSSATDRLFLADKGPAKGTPFSKDQFHEVLERARIRAGLDHLGSRRLREIGLRCLRAGGMDEDALRMQIGEQPLIQRTERWHCEEYQRVAPCLDALIPGTGGERRSV